jgi:hypothetical protein
MKTNTRIKTLNASPKNPLIYYDITEYFDGEYYFPIDNDYPNFYTKSILCLRDILKAHFIESRDSKFPWNIEYSRNMKATWDIREPYVTGYRWVNIQRLQALEIFYNLKKNPEQEDSMISVCFDSNKFIKVIYEA